MENIRFCSPRLPLAANFITLLGQNMLPLVVLLRTSVVFARFGCTSRAKSSILQRTTLATRRRLHDHKDGDVEEIEFKLS